MHTLAGRQQNLVSQGSSTSAPTRDEGSLRAPLRGAEHGSGAACCRL